MRPEGTAAELERRRRRTGLSAPSPVYTKFTAHDGPNRLGLSLHTMSTPVIDRTHNRLFISDTNNSRVLVYSLTSTGAFVDRIPDSVLGQANFYTNTVATTQAGMSSPYGLAYDATNNRLFVAHSGNNRVTI